MLKKANKSLLSNDLGSYYNNISQALFGYLGDKLKIKTADFTLNKAIDQLSEKEVNEELINNIKKISDRCEFARFAPNAVEDDNGKTIFQNVLSIIDDLEKELKNKK